MLDRAQDAGFLSPRHRADLLFHDDPAGLLDALEGWEPPPRAVPAPGI
jgi:hypothetical protein